MNNLYKSYGVWEGSERIQEGVRIWKGAGGQGSKKGLGSGMELGGSGGVWGLEGVWV